MSAESPPPNWEGIVDTFDKIDAIIDDAIIKKNLNFLEIDFAILMIKEKIEQEKHKILNEMFQKEEVNEHIHEPKQDDKSRPEFYR